MSTNLPFLSDIELREMAAPLKQRAAIKRWFTRQGFRFHTKPNGMPLISRAQITAFMEGIPAATESPSEQPDTAALMRYFQENMSNGAQA